MYIYDLDVSMSDKELIFDKNLMEAIKQAINIANSSFSAIIYNRKIELVETINNTNIHLRMTSRNPINATRSLSSLSRALVRKAPEPNHFLHQQFKSNRNCARSSCNSTWPKIFK